MITLWPHTEGRRLVSSRRRFEPLELDHLQRERERERGRERERERERERVSECVCERETARGREKQRERQSARGRKAEAGTQTERKRQRQREKRDLIGPAANYCHAAVAQQAPPCGPCARHLRDLCPLVGGRVVELAAPQPLHAAEAHAERQ